MYSYLKKVNRGLVLFALVVLCCVAYLLIMEAGDTKAKSTIEEMTYTFTNNIDTALVVTTPDKIYTYNYLDTTPEIQALTQEIISDSIDSAFPDKSILPENKDVSESFFAPLEFVLYMEFANAEAISYSKSEIIKVKSVSIYKNTGTVKADVLWEFETTDSQGNTQSYSEWCEEVLTFYKDEDRWHFESWSTNRGSTININAFASHDYSTAY